jgi:16S rRNA (cytosine967-C5)-methyltransferase
MNFTSLVGHIIELCEQIDASTTPADKLTSNFIRERKYLGSHDRRYITSIVFGILRNRRYIEALLEQYLAAYPSREAINIGVQRYVPLIGAYLAAVEHETDENLNQILSTRWKTAFPGADLMEYVRWVRENAGLEFLPEDNTVRPGVKYSFQDWMVKRLRDEYGADLEPLLSSLNTPANTALRVNALKCTRDECKARLQSEEIDTEISPYSPAGLVVGKRFNKEASACFKEGWFEIQDEGSQIVSLLAGVKQGQTIIDACAGTGGKTLHLAELMRDTGEIIAIDVDAKRLYELQARAARAGITNIQVLLKERMLPENFHAKADVVLIDAPCSGSGTIRRNPGLKWRLSESLISHYAGMQREILAFNAPFVKHGGTLVYVTCSLFKEENEEIIENFLSAHPEFALTSLKEDALRFGVATENAFAKLLPHKLNSDGFFVAGMRRT